MKAGSSRAFVRVVLDCIVIGGGPAGLSASLLLARYQRRVLTFHSNSPRNLYSHGVHGFLGHDGILPAELLRLGRAEVARYGGLIREERVETVDAREDGFRVQAGARSFTARKLLLATGLRDHTPDCPGFAQLYGRSVHHCPDCDGYEVRGKKVVVLGHPDTIDGFAKNLLAWTDDITLIVEPGEGVLCDTKFPLLEGDVAALEGDWTSGQLERVCFLDGAVFCCDALFFNLGIEPACDLHLQLGCECESTGLVRVNQRQETSVPGVYAAGDLTPHSQLAIVAAAEGAMAAISIHKTLCAESA